MIGRITFWNQPRGFGFITVTRKMSPLEAPSQEQIFFHHSNFKEVDNPVLGAYVVFAMAPGVAEGKKPQAVGVRFANSQEIAEVTASRQVVSLLSGADAPNASPKMEVQR